MPFLQIPAESHYWLRNARVPLTLLANGSLNWPLVEQFQRSQYRESLVAVDIEVRDGTVERVQPAIASQSADAPTVDVRSGLIWPCFVDMHTHLDKGHIWSRSPNPNGTFDGALETVQQDCAQRWQAEDVYRRMAFGLKCSYAHGTQAIRTHLDAFDDQGEISFEVFRQLRQEWKNKVFLQAVCLVSLDYFTGPKGEKLANLVADSGGILGGVAYMNPNIVQQIDRVFDLSQRERARLRFSHR